MVTGSAIAGGLVGKQRYDFRAPAVAPAMSARLDRVRTEQGGDCVPTWAYPCAVSARWSPRCGRALP
jgi:hypothetical protein